MNVCFAKINYRVIVVNKKQKVAQLRRNMHQINNVVNSVVIVNRKHKVTHPKRNTNHNLVTKKHKINTTKKECQCCL